MPRPLPGLSSAQSSRTGRDMRTWPCLRKAWSASSVDANSANPQPFEITCFSIGLHLMADSASGSKNARSAASSMSYDRLPQYNLQHPSGLALGSRTGLSDFGFGLSVGSTWSGPTPRSRSSAPPLSTPWPHRQTRARPCP